MLLHEISLSALPDFDIPFFYTLESFKVESMVLLTADPRILRYGVETLWAAL
jgi:hypothetical protein